MSARTPEFNKALEAYVACVNAVVEAGRVSNYRTTKVEESGGRKYLKLVTREYDKETGERSTSGESVYAFIEVPTGNVYKPASYKAPTKNHVRGNIFNLADALRWVNAYGINYISTSGAPPAFCTNDNFFEKVRLSAATAARLRKEYGLTS